MFGNGPTTLKFKKRAAYYSNSTGSCEYYPESETAYSYDWWRFVERIKGQLIFNDYSYSSQTNSHQYAVKHLLETMNKTFRIVNAPRGLNNLKDSFKHYFRQACELEVEMSRNGTRLDTNESRLNKFNNLMFKLIELESIGAKVSQKEQKEIRDAAFKSEQDRLEYKAKQKQALKDSLNTPITEVLTNN